MPRALAGEPCLKEGDGNVVRPVPALGGDGAPRPLGRPHTAPARGGLGSGPAPAPSLHSVFAGSSW